MTLSVLSDVATLIPVDAVTSGRALVSEMQNKFLDGQVIKILQRYGSYYSIIEITMVSTLYKANVDIYLRPKTSITLPWVI